MLASLTRFLCVDDEVSCLDLFQSMLMKMMFAYAVLCSSGTAPEIVLCSSDTVPELAALADHMVLLVVAATARAAHCTCACAGIS